MRDTSDRYRGFIARLGRESEGDEANGCAGSGSVAAAFKPPVDFYRSRQSTPFGIILEKIKSSHDSAALSLPGRAEPIGRRPPSADGGTARALEVWLCRCGSYATRVELDLALQNCSSAGARQSAVLW